MSRFVLDSSVALSWLLPDESSGDHILEELTQNGGLVPQLWHLEVGNSLLSAERKGRITSFQRRQALHSLEALPIEIDVKTMHQAWHNTIDLAEQYKLTLYDATYLELAMRFAAPLATYDKALQAAAHQVSISLIL